MIAFLTHRNCSPTILNVVSVVAKRYNTPTSRIWTTIKEDICSVRIVIVFVSSRSNREHFVKHFVKHLYDTLLYFVFTFAFIIVLMDHGVCFGNSQVRHQHSWLDVDILLLQFFSTTVRVLMESDIAHLIIASRRNRHTEV